MKRFIRLIKEFSFALTFFKNPRVYCRERFGQSRGKNVILELRNGLRYSLNTNTNEIRMVNEIWNMKVYDALRSYVRNGSTVVDIGANIGVFSLKVADWGRDVKVFSYEPFPQSFAGLQENIRLNGLEKNVFPINKAVAGKRGELELFWRPNDPGGVSIYKYGDTDQLNSIKVPAITLEDIFLENKIDTCDFIKIDCEGAEEEILLNAPRELFGRIRSITLEWHYDLNKLSVEEFTNFLRSLGYNIQYNQRTLTLYAWCP